MIVPNDNDVLFGRGYAIMTHPGNEKLRLMVGTQRETFRQSKKMAKRDVAINIVDEIIHKRNGRFLMEDPQQENNNNSNSPPSIVDRIWIVVEWEKAIKKVMHLLREKERGEKKKSKNEHEVPVKSGEDAAMATCSSMQENLSVGPSSYNSGALGTSMPLNIPSNSNAAANNNLDMLQSLVNNPLVHNGLNDAVVDYNSGSLQSMLQSMGSNASNNHMNLLNTIMMGNNNLHQQQQPMATGITTAGLTPPIPPATTTTTTASVQDLLQSIIGDPQLQTTIGSNPSPLDNLVAARASSAAPSTDNLLPGILSNVGMRQQSNAMTNNSSLQNHQLVRTIGQTIGSPSLDNNVRASNNFGVQQLNETATNRSLQNQLQTFGISSLDSNVARGGAINNIMATQQSIDPISKSILSASLENAARAAGLLSSSGNLPDNSINDRPTAGIKSVLDRNVLSSLNALKQGTIKSDVPSLNDAMKQNVKSDDSNNQAIAHIMKRLADEGSVPGQGNTLKQNSIKSDDINDTTIGYTMRLAGSGGQGCIHLLSSDNVTRSNGSNTITANANMTSCESPDVPDIPSAQAKIPTAAKVSIAHSGSIDDPITVKEWMESTLSDTPSKEVYILSALELALVLARKLRYLIDSPTAAINPEDISIEKVLFYMERQSPFSSSRDSPSIQSVKFLGESSVAHLLTQRPDATGHIMPLQPRAACASLGKLLLQIFTQNLSISASEEKTPQSKDREDIDSRDTIAPPLKKRKMPAPLNDSISSNKAHNLLTVLEMPLAICQLVCDLLDAETEGSLTTSTALTSMDEILFDLEQMKSNPASFLFDRTCPQGALDDAHLFINSDLCLVGREKEMSALLNSKDICMETVSNRDPFAASSVQQQQSSSFHCEAAFLSGYSGSGKSLLLRSLTSSCEDDQWFVLGCKFDKQVAPHTVLFRAFDDFFGKLIDAIDNSSNSDHFSSSMTISFRKACRGIFSAMDEDGLDQLTDLVPNVAKIFPILAAKSNNGKHDCRISSMDKVGSAQKRLQNLFHVILKSLCSVGRPVLFVIDDLQWSDTFIMEALSDFVVSYMYGGISSVDGDKSRGGLFIAGAYRSNEVKSGDDLLRMIDYIKQSRKANVITMTVGELSNADVNQLISKKLCLPWRYTRELAGLVHSKTRGNPFFVIQFLRTLVQNKLLEYSVLSRRWMWDCDCVEMQMISDGVAQLLTTSFDQLPSELVQTMKVVSCLGYQVERPTIHALDLTREVLPCCMLDQMQLAVKEGFIEKAGPVYQFTHDIIKETVYDLIPGDKRGALHRAIGLSLLKPRLNNTTIQLLAADQINVYCRDGVPGPEERTMFADINAQAAKFALASSSFRQARSYINAGIKLLQMNSWETQYDLSLKLYDMSASVSCVYGDNATMSNCLSEILTHAKSFDDSLTAAGLLAKLLAFNSKYDEARSNCFGILSNLGEEFPADVGLPLSLKELSNMENVLKNISHAQIKTLPLMTDKTKLNAMRFLNMLCMYSGISKPLLLPILSCRMVKLTLQHGFCEDSIVGIATAGYSLFVFTEDVPLAMHLGKVSESLVEESPKKNSIRSRLSIELLCTLRMMNEPWHSVLALYPQYYRSAMLAGDVENAMVCRFYYVFGSFWSGAIGISALSKHFTMCMKETAKYEMKMVMYSSMAGIIACSCLSGKSCTEEITVKTLDELDAIEGKTNLLIWQVFVFRLANSFWMRDYAAVAKLSEEYTRKHPSAQQKRILHIYRAFYEGIAYLNLARSVQRPELRALGEKAMATITQLEMTTMCKQNLENKSKLLQAELCYLNGDLEASEAAYQASICSASEQKFIHEEALAYELYGRFLVENHNAKQGLVRLRLALDKYKEWGAMKIAHNLQFYADSVELQTLPNC